MATCWWSNPVPANNLEASECKTKSSRTAKKLEVVAPAAAERSVQSRWWPWCCLSSEVRRLWRIIHWSNGAYSLCTRPGACGLRQEWTIWRVCCCRAIHSEQHALDFDYVEVIDYGHHGMKWRVKEALYINAENHSMNNDRGLELNPIWFSLFPYNPFVVFQNPLLTLSLSYLLVTRLSLARFLVTRLFVCSFPSHLVVP